MLKKRLTGVLLAGLLLVLVLPSAASAHVLKVDGQIGAVLHIRPDDNPTIGQSTSYVISFSDESRRFNLSDCDCEVLFIKDGQTIDRRNLAKTSPQISENHYTFAKPGVYDLRIIGQPKTAGAFANFQLDYEVRVSGGQGTNQAMPALLWVGLALAIGLILLAAFTVNYDSPEGDSEL